MLVPEHIWTRANEHDMRISFATYANDETLGPPSTNFSELVPVQNLEQIQIDGTWVVRDYEVANGNWGDDPVLATDDETFAGYVLVSNNETSLDLASVDGRTIVQLDGVYS